MKIDWSDLVAKIIVGILEAFISALLLWMIWNFDYLDVLNLPNIEYLHACWIIIMVRIVLPIPDKRKKD